MTTRLLERLDDRIGFGTMQLTGPGIWGPPADRQHAIHLLRSAYKWGVRVFDTAWYYGPGVTHRLLAEALAPFPDDLLLVTKAGNSRGPNKSWVPALSADQLRSAIDADLSQLQLDVLPLVLLRWNAGADEGDSFIVALKVMIDLMRSGRIDSIGLSNVTLDNIKRAMDITAVAAVSNAFSIYNQRDRGVLDFCTTEGIPYLPYYPLLGGEVLRKRAIQKVARIVGATPAQVALAWLRAQSPVVLPIPGTGNVKHLRENIAAIDLEIPAGLIASLDAPQGNEAPW